MRLNSFSVGPVFTKKPSAVYAYVRDTARFECEADGIPKPNITWSKNGEEQTNSDYITVGDGFLIVYDLVSSDMGAYQCFAKSYLGTIQATAELSVFRKGNHCIYRYMVLKAKCCRPVMHRIVVQNAMIFRQIYKLDF